MLGNLVGSWIAYAIGYYGRLELVERHRIFHTNRRYLEWADDWFKRHGDATVFFSRMLPDHPDLHLAARRGRADALLALHWATLAGCIPWVLALALIGKGVGSKWHDWKDHLQYLDYAVLAPSWP